MSGLEPDEYLGKEVVVETSLSKWTGTAVAYSDGPSVLIEAGDGTRYMLPANSVRVKAQPWHAAKPGEAWLIKTCNVANAVVVLVCDGKFRYNDGETVPLTYEAIEAAKRVWPVVDDA